MCRLLIVFSQVAGLCAGLSSNLRATQTVFSSSSQATPSQQQTAAGTVVVLAVMLIGIALSLVGCLLAEIQVKPVAEKTTTKSGAFDENCDMWSDDSEDVSTADSQLTSGRPQPVFYKTPPPSWWSHSPAYFLI